LSTIFLLSPAHCGGKRAGYLLNDAASFPLALRLRETGISVGEAFSFLSGLYFRGKLAYADRFAEPPEGESGVQVITTNRGLIPAETSIRLADLRAFGQVDIDPDDPRYRSPLDGDLARLASSSSLTVVLLGSIATPKYVTPLLASFGERLLFPSAFVGRGDMSRGSLLLRAAREGRPLDYLPVLGAVRSTARSRKATNAL
jgi:hypothetical protein